MKSQTAVQVAPSRVQTHLAFARALGTGDLELATTCFARDACLITADATVVHGRDRIRPLLAQLIARRIEVTVELSNIFGGGDVAIARERWSIRSAAAGPFVQTIYPALVMRRIESEWKLVIAAPWGWTEWRS